MSSEVVAALLGAIAAGIFRTPAGIVARRREAKSVLVAIASEIAAVCRLIQHQKYYENLAHAANEIRAGTWGDRTWIVDLRSNYFSVFDALAPKLGVLAPYEAAQIVKFYAYCKAVIDGTRPDGPMAEDDPDLEAVGNNLLSIKQMLAQAPRLGDAIVQSRGVI